MRIRTADAERTNSGPTWRGIPLPLRQARVNPKWTIREIEIRVWAFEMERGWKNAIANNVSCINEPGYTRSDIQMANIGFCRPNDTRLSFGFRVHETP